MEPYQQRVITEKAELDEKRNKLLAFIGGAIYHTLPKVEQSRLNRQLEAMTLYSNILGERIAAFGLPEQRPPFEHEEDLTHYIQIMKAEGRASVSHLQRRMRIGYVRAAAIIDELERRGIVGPSKGAEPRDILVEL